MNASSIDQHSIYLQTLLGVAFALLVTFAICGNLLVCLAVCSDRRLRKQENIFLVNLAVADMLVAALVMTFAAANDLTGEWIFGWYCSPWMALDICTCTSSILSLTAISFDRYWHIRHPLRYGITMTRNKILMMVIAIWLVSGTISILPFALGLHQSQYTTDRVCYLKLSLPYAVSSSAVSFFIPCVAMLFIYSRLYTTARKVSQALNGQFMFIEAAALFFVPKNLFRETRTESTPDVNLASSPCFDTPRCHRYKPSGSTTRANQDNKARKTIGVIMGVFLACWLPFFLVNIAQAACDGCVPVWVFQSVTWIGYANSAANPLIYGITSTEFRSAFRSILTMPRRRHLPHIRVAAAPSPPTESPFAPPTTPRSPRPRPRLYGATENDAYRKLSAPSFQQFNVVSPRSVQEFNQFNNSRRASAVTFV